MDSINAHITKFAVFLDANVLYKSHLRDLLLRLSRKDTFRVYWSDDVLAELRSNLVAKAGLHDTQVNKLLQALQRVFPDSCVSGYEDLVAGIVLDAEKDRHVLAAAVCANCDVIVTDNVRDFPDTSLAKYAIEVQSPDTFLCHHYSLEQGKTIRAIQEHLSMLTKPPLTFAEYVNWLESAGAVVFAEQLRQDKVEDLVQL